MLSSRKKEEYLLKQCYSNNQVGIVVLYGVEGIGKTTLVRDFCKDKRSFYYMAKQASELQQKMFFCQEVKTKFNAELASLDYYEGFNAICDKSDNKTVIVLDEFQFIAKKDEELLKSLINFSKDNIDKVLFVLLSSQVGWIGNDFTNSFLSLINKKTILLHKIDEIGFVDLVQTLEKYDTRECVKIYSLIGGVPKYIVNWNRNRNIKDNVCRLFLNPNGLLANEVERIIGNELREQAVYSTILYSLATNKNKLNDLYIHTGFSRAKISVYINNLIDLDIVEKVDSYDTAGRVNTKKGVYQIKSTIVNFYFRFIYPNLSDLNSMSASDFYDTYIDAEFNDYLDRYFVKVCKEYLMLLSKIGKLPISISKIGSWVGKQGNIDIIASDANNKAIIGLCRWKEKTVTYGMCLDLFNIMSQAKVSADYYYLFSSKSFDEKLKKEAAKEPRIILVDISSL